MSMIPKGGYRFSEEIVLEREWINVLLY